MSDCTKPPAISAPSQNAQRVRIAIASTGDAYNPSVWSGTPYFMARALERELGSLTYICPIEGRLFGTLTRLARMQEKVTGWKTKPNQSWSAARFNARTLSNALAEKRPDALFAPAGSALLAALNTDVPIIYTSDATVQLMDSYYGQFSSLSRHALRMAHELEQASIDRADLLLYPTQWAADSAIAHYGADPAKTHILPYGANFTDIPLRAAALAPRREGPLRLIFVGVDWQRKGGDIAVEALRALNARGIATEMTVVGCVPPEHVPRDHLTVYPFLSKSDPVQLAKLSALYLKADLLFVPTRAECYGVVWCEAAAHGLPSISTATGGVPGVVREGVTGHLLPPEADGGHYADLIARLASDSGYLAALKENAREDFETRLDWAVWARNFIRLTAPIISRNIGHSSFLS